MNINKNIVTTPCKKIRLDARTNLKGKWGTSVAVYIIFVLLLSVAGIISSLFGYLTDGKAVSLAVPFALLCVLWAVAGLFIEGYLTAGYYSTFLKASKGENIEVKNMFGNVNLAPKYTGTFVISTIKTFLWSLLLIVPGIIAGLNYSMAYFVLAEDPSVGANEAIEISKKLMKGNKGKLFLLNLSYIWWYLLAAVTFGIATLWIAPYVATANGRFYQEITAKKE